MRDLLRKKWFWLILGVLVLLAAVGPSYNFVSVRNADGSGATVQKAGFGPQTIRVTDGDIRVEAAGR